MQQTAVTAEERMFQVECCVSATWKEKEYVMRPKPSDEEIRQRARQLWEQSLKTAMTSFGALQSENC
jgi:hypothetical protein